MPATTPNGVPYPIGTDRLMDGDDAIHNLAQWLDDALNTRVKLSNNASQNLPDSTKTQVVWQVEEIDPKDLHSTVTNPTRVTIKQAGRYRVMASISISSGGGGTGYRRLTLTRTGTDICIQQVYPIQVTQYSSVAIACTVLCAAGDYLEICATQTSGAALTVTQSSATFFEVEYAGAI